MKTPALPPILHRLMSLAKSVHGQTLATGLGMAFSQVTAFASVYLLARGLGPAELGRYQLFMGVMVAISFVAKLGFDEGLSYVLPRLAGRSAFGLISIAVGGVTIISIGLGSLIYLGATPLSQVVFRLPALAADLRQMAWVLPAYIFLVLATSALRGLGRSDLRAHITYFGINGAFLVALGILSQLELSTSKVIVSRGIILLAFGCVSFMVVGSATRFQLERPAIGDLTALTKMSLLMVPIGLLQYLADQPFVDMTIISRVSSAEAVGVYSVASRVGALVLLPLNALTIVMGPTFSRLLGKQSTVELQDQLTNSLKWLWACSCVSMTLLFWFAPDVLAVFGREFSGGVTVLRVFAVGYGAVSVLGLNTPLLLALGAQKLELKVAVTTVLLMVVGDLILGYIFGTVGVALATVVALLVGAVSRHVISTRLLPLDLFPKREAWRVTVSWGVAVAFLRLSDFLGLKGLERVMVGGLVFVAAFGGALWWAQHRPADTIDT